MKMRRERDFERILLEAIDEGLAALGEGGKHMVFFYLERNCSIRKQDIPKKPEAFVTGLEKIFGAGAPVLEKMILERICAKLGSKHGGEEKRLASYIRKIAQETHATTSSFEERKEQNDDSAMSAETLESHQAFKSGSFVEGEIYETVLHR